MAMMKEMMSENRNEKDGLMKEMDNQNENLSEMKQNLNEVRDTLSRGLSEVRADARQYTDIEACHERMVESHRAVVEQAVAIAGVTGGLCVEEEPREPEGPHTRSVALRNALCKLGLHKLWPSATHYSCPLR
ncbi:hypothetical protein GWK47_021774 [Chionoecetes opilio]|uniref:Uncharacterized protein n=1 Tax=Chionoecetes opilio TaxID=41210 RepID=A0A8J4XP64_CHIOP|nr:hypothetical protein GWK47_021774 [Chionoecetes opilio]